MYKICHISMYAWASGGLSKTVFDHANRQAKAGHAVSILTVIDTNETLYDVPEKVTLLKFSKHFLSKFVPMFSADFYKYLKNHAEDFDIIHIHGLFHFGSIAPFFFAKNKVKVITVHGMLETWAYAKGALKKQIFSWLIQRNLVKKASFVHVLQQEEWNDTQKYLGGFDKNLVMIPNGIEIAQFTDIEGFKGNFREKYNIAEDVKIILFLGRLSAKKGLDLLLPAFAEVLKENPKCMLVLAGPADDYQQEIDSFIANSQGEHNILLTGMVVGTQKIEVLADADIFVLPSYSEGFSIAVLEAMAAKIPTLVSDKIGFTDEARKWQATQISDLTIEKISQDLKQMLNDENYCNQLKINAFEMLKSKYDIDAVAQALMNEYQKVASPLTPEGGT